MKIATRILGILICLALMPAAVLAQAQAKSAGELPATHIRLDILLTEFNGQQKVSSLPYTMYVEVPPTGDHSGHGSLRMGVRVPVRLGGGPGLTASYTYQDVGTDMDCDASRAADGTYDIRLVIRRSSVYSSDTAGTDSQGIHGEPGRPVIRNFNTDFNLKMRDGETTEGPSATDPFNGHVLKVSLTLHVIK